MLEPTLYTVQYRIPDTFNFAWLDYIRESGLSRSNELELQHESWNLVIRELYRQLPKFSYDERLQYRGLFSVTSTFPIKKGHAKQIAKIIEDVTSGIFNGHSFNVDKSSFVNRGKISNSDFYEFMETRYYESIA